MSMSPLQQARLEYRPKLPKSLQNIKNISFVQTEHLHSSKVLPQIAALFPKIYPFPILEEYAESNLSPPLRVGVVFSGGQAPGGHNVISGLYDALKTLNEKSTLIGFLNGPSGIIEDKTLIITRELLSKYRNQGGFDLIGSGRTKIESLDQFKAAEATVRKHQLDGLIIIGGDDSNTNAAFLAEYFLANNCKTCVIGVPKTVDGDLKTTDIEISFGFDSAAKHYSETIGSLMRDAISAKKYYYFIKLMGRSASHITLECALQTHPNLALISEEIAEKKTALKDLIHSLCDLICARAAKGKAYGVVLIPEGIVEFIPDVKQLIHELNNLLSVTTPHHSKIESFIQEQEKIDYISSWLSKDSLACFQMLPKDNQSQLLIGRDSHGNVQVSKIETEQMIIEMIQTELKKRTEKENYKGVFSPIPHFCGYEGRSCLPSNFDSQYCYALGHIAALLINNQATGYICCLKNLFQPVEEWIPCAIPLTTLMILEERHGKQKPVIQKALVDLNGQPFASFNAQRDRWATEDDYINPGPIQFFGPLHLRDSITHTLELEGQSGKQDRESEN